MELVRRLLCFQSERAVEHPLKHAASILSRRFCLDLKNATPVCVSTLKEHGTTTEITATTTGTTRTITTTTKKGHIPGHVFSVAFHPTAPYFATGSADKTAKVWLLNTDCTAATSVCTLAGHAYNGVTSVAFHPTAPYLATGSSDGTAKVWLLNADCTAATIVCTLKGHKILDTEGHYWDSDVLAVAFHPTAPYIITGGSDGNAKLWR